VDGELFFSGGRMGGCCTAAVAKLLVRSLRSAQSLI
jgi:hypothetical protein